MRCTLLLAAALAACNAPGDARWAGSVDTLETGAIVTHNPPVGLWGAHPWRLERVVRIGRVTGADPFVFGRVSDVVLGPDTLVYVLDALAHEVRVFDLAGRHMRTIGRAGEGPGEFLSPYALAIDPHGRLWVADQSSIAYSVFDGDGTFLRRRQKPSRWPLTPGLLSFSSDGSLYEYGRLAGGNAAVRMTVDSEIVARDTVTLAPFTPLLFQRPPGQGERMGTIVPYSPRQVTAVGPRGDVWTGVGDRYRVANVRGDDDTVRVVELEAPRASLSDAERHRADSVAARAAARGFVADRSRIPSAHPYFTSLTVDEDDRLWVRRPAADPPLEPDGTCGAVYDVFTPGGRYLGSVPAPVDAVPAPYITRRYLVGVRRDTLDVPYVEVFRIVRADPSPSRHLRPHSP
jgi:hypothetical protein